MSRRHRPHPRSRAGQEPADFDAFYLGSRRRLLLQCLALTGDLSASRSAVRDAFVAARHHWRKVGHLDQPEDWVRPRAWSTAQRRSVARIWHREKGLTEQQTAVLDALSRLSDAQRRTLLLAQLASVSLPQIGRELAQTRMLTERNLQQGTDMLALTLGCDASAIRTHLASLAPLVSSPGLPRVTVIRRSGQRRRRLHAATGSVLALAVTVGAGWFVSAGGHGTETVQAQTHPVTRAMLLSPGQVAPIAPKQTWQVVRTDDNTSGSGINTICQRSRFADDRGLGTWVRALHADGKPARDVIQTVEISASPGAARRAFATTLGWYAGCQEARVQLGRSYRVSNLGDQAEALRINLAGKQRRSFVLAIARSGSLTSSTVLTTHGSRPDPLRPVLQVAAAAMRDVCPSSAVTHCVTGPIRVTPVLPPPSGEVPGMLATPDLPPIATIDKPWVGTDPITGGPNLAATTCDHANFAAAGSAPPRSRTFLIPQARLPERFGLTEVYGTFPSTRSARKFVTTIRHRMATCQHHQLGTTISHHTDRMHGLRGSTYSVWRQTAEINRKKAVVSFWMGIAQVGRHVAQVNLTPSRHDDVAAPTFRALVARARDRLFELKGTS
ncbi:SigE family RNA polymerase sigma factor [Nocardioides terrisoli]|uniref:hypothetical protein n=1 Tax=Nocardioides terrisoli TaxID=3388267 RepID=UPI00287B8D19|nr:hypothetical protein [Nocardioides marmorisolisilvae]